MIIALMGYMGSGKSTIGQHLANQLNYAFLDLDSYIELQEKQSINAIFETKGELYFRKQEAIYLLQLLEKYNNLVLALGGGTPCYANNLDTLKTHNKVKLIYLKYTIPTLAQRLFNERKHRPLIAHIENETDLQEYIGKHLFERVNFYNKADFVIDGEAKTLQAIAKAIVSSLI